MFKKLGLVFAALAIVFFSILVIPGQANAAVTYRYAGGNQVLTGTDFAPGFQANLLVGAPYVDSANGDHSLTEIAISRNNTHGRDVAEFGWAAEPNAFGDTKPRLFASYWKDGTWGGTYYGGSLWVDKTPTIHTDDLGADLSSVASATFPNNVKQFKVVFESPTTCGANVNSGNFDFYYAGTLIGCMPPAQWGNGYGSGSTIFQVFGEVATQRASGLSCSDMGNGKQGNSAVLPLDASDPAYVGSASLIGPSPATLTTNLTLFNTDVNAYSAFSLGSTGNRTFTYGGPGYSSTGTTPGTTGGC